METKEATMAHIIGENIRNLRKARRMTQHQLAAVKDIGISQPSLAAYETGAREPSARVINSLADFFNTVPHKTTKTTEKYRLLSGTLTLKKGTVKATVDDSKLVPWLRENGYGDLVKVEESAKWGELKKLLAYTGEIATIQSTGEIVEGVTAYETPATFTVDI